MSDNGFDMTDYDHGDLPDPRTTESDRTPLLDPESLGGSQPSSQDPTWGTDRLTRESWLESMAAGPRRRGRGTVREG